MVFVGDIEEWIKTNKDKQFIMWVYRRGYTPYEIDKRFSDQSHFEDSRGDVIRIVELINLGNGDYYIGTQSYNEIDERFFNQVEYYRLSEIRLARKITSDNSLYSE